MLYAAVLMVAIVVSLYSLLVEIWILCAACVMFCAGDVLTSV
jgi:hypothetical protein